MPRRTEDQQREVRQLLEQARLLAAKLNGATDWDLMALNNIAAELGVRFKITEIPGSPGHYEAQWENLSDWKD